MNIGGPEEFAQIDRRAARQGRGIRQGARHQAAAVKPAGYGLLTSVCTLIAICHWPLRFTQTRAAR